MCGGCGGGGVGAYTEILPFKSWYSNAHTHMISAFGGQRQKNHNFKVTLATREVQEWPRLPETLPQQSKTKIPQRWWLTPLTQHKKVGTGSDMAGRGQERRIQSDVSWSGIQSRIQVDRIPIQSEEIVEVRTSSWLLCFSNFSPPNV